MMTICSHFCIPFVVTHFCWFLCSQMTFGLQSMGVRWLLECALEFSHKRSCVMSVKVRHLPSSLTIFSTPRVFSASLVCLKGTSSVFVCHAYCTTSRSFLSPPHPTHPTLEMCRSICHFHDFLKQLQLQM